MTVQAILDDLIAEQQALDDVVGNLSEEHWATATPSPGWTIADQIAHLTYFDATAALAIRDTAAFIEHRAHLVQLMADPDSTEAETMGPLRALTGEGLLSEWRANRRALEAAGRGLAEDARVEWYGPSMGAKSFLTARLMEAWAHGQDVVDTLGATRPASDRLRHIAQLGVITRGWSYINRGLEVPAGNVAVTLTAPSGEVWEWSQENADATVSGSAEEFCMVVTQRRHVDDTNLVTDGELARDWMLQAQAFAGGATDGPSAGTWKDNCWISMSQQRTIRDASNSESGSPNIHRRRAPNYTRQVCLFLTGLVRGVLKQTQFTS